MPRDHGSHIWLKSLTRSMGHAEAKELLNNYARLEDTEGRLNADAVVELVSDVNSSLFEQIVREGGLMSETLKELIEPEQAKLQRKLYTNEAGMLFSARQPHSIRKSFPYIFPDSFAH